MDAIRAPVVASVLFAAVALAPAAPFAQSAQPKSTTRVIPCDASCKRQLCTNKGADHAKVVCHSAVPEHMTQCILRNERKYVEQCMRNPLGED